MRKSMLSIMVLIFMMSASKVFATDINIGTVPLPNLYIAAPPIQLPWFEMYVGKEQSGDLGVCYSSVQGDAIDGKHVGIGFVGLGNIWGPYIGIAIGTYCDFSWGNLYDNDKLDYINFNIRIPVSLVIQVVRIDNAAINIYGGGDINGKSTWFDLPTVTTGNSYDTYKLTSLAGSFPLGYHVGLQASGRYAGLAITALAGMQSIYFKESKYEYENTDDDNTYYFKIPAETIKNYFYGIKLSVIPWDISLSYTYQKFDKSDKTGFPEFSQHTFMITFLVAGKHADVKEEKKEEKPKQQVDAV
ncbi:MAG TPA: hypothetical protein PK348_04200 [Spirochaetota bacterium]|nr:hypothetical protein [Spirochaetota bacterium]